MPSSNIQDFRIRDLLMFNLLSIFCVIIGELISGVVVVPYFNMIAFYYIQATYFIYPIAMSIFLIAKSNKLMIRKEDYIGSFSSRGKLMLLCEILGVAITITLIFTIAADLGLWVRNIEYYNRGFLWGNKILVAFFALIYTAIIEIQRAIIIQRITKRWNVWVAIIISMVPFIMIAGEYFLDSLLFSLLYIQTESIIPSYVARIMLFILSLLNNAGVIYISDIPLVQKWVLLGFCFIVLLYYFYCNWPSVNWKKEKK